MGAAQRTICYLSCIQYHALILYRVHAWQANNYPWKEDEGEDRAEGVQDIMIQGTAIILLISGLALVSADDQVWDWRYAYTILFSIIGSMYLNCVTVSILLWGHDNKEETNQDQKQKACFLCIKVILQPVLFTEGWITTCLCNSS